MKSFVPVFLVFAAILALSVADADWKAKERLMQEKYEDAQEVCAVKHHLSAVQLRQLRNVNRQLTREEKCACSCILTEMGLMSDGRFNRDSFDDTADALFEEEPEMLAVTKQISKRCEKHIHFLKLEDECEIGGAIYMCIRRMSKSISLKDYTEY